MLSAIALLLPVLAVPGIAPVGVSALNPSEPPVRLWMSGDRRFEPGDRARVQVEARDDGYLLVLHYDTDGRVRVLFPLDPRDDAFVRGGRRYEVRDYSSRESFTVGMEGAGFVYVALSPDPWDLRLWSRGSNWDYERIAVDYDTDDPERDLTGLLERISGPRGFDYDLMEYYVHDVEVVRYEYRPSRYYTPGVWLSDPWCDPYWSTGWFCASRPGVVINHGRFYGGTWWSIGYGPSWYWPSSSWYRYRPYSYGRGYHLTYHRPWVWSTPTYRPIHNRPVIIGRSRDYRTGRLSPWTFDQPTARSPRPAPALGDAYRPGDGGATRSRPVTGSRPTPEASRGRPATDRAAPPPSAGRARPDNSRPAAAQPTGRRTGDGNAPAARPAQDRQPPAPVRSRPRGNDEQPARSAPAARTSEPDRPAAESPRPSQPATRSRPAASESRPAAAQARQAPAERAAPQREASRPAAQPQAARSAPPAASSRPAARSAPPAARPQAAPARSASSDRRPAPARSRGNN